jgi:hypothetical protein
MGVLVDGEPMSCRVIIRVTGLSRSQFYNALYRCWRRGLVLRTVRSLLRHERVFKGRGGVFRQLRPFHLYLLRPDGVCEVVVGGWRYVGFSEEYLDPRGGSGLSKAKRVLGFLEENADSAFFSRYVVDALSEFGVRTRDVMSNVRRFERRGLVYVRGYKTDEAETPFRRWYLLTWLRQGVPRGEAAAEWFIDRFTTGARFWTQRHWDRGMDPRRITLHLLRGVGRRRRAADVDRVWEVNPRVFTPPITYVLSCKWGLVSKRHVDDFLEVLRWSKVFGVDTPEGTETKQGVVALSVHVDDLRDGLPHIFVSEVVPVLIIYLSWRIRLCERHLINIK